MQQVTIKNNFISLGVLDYGAIVQKILFRDKNGKELNLVVGFENPEDYLEDQKVLGACVGRFAGRISNGGFRINDTSYNLFTVDGVHLHGGKNGFSKKYWTLDKVVHEEQPLVKMTYKSPHMEEGYPGNLTTLIFASIRQIQLIIMNCNWNVLKYWKLITIYCLPVI